MRATPRYPAHDAIVCGHGSRQMSQAVADQAPLTADLPKALDHQRLADANEESRAGKTVSTRRTMMPSAVVADSRHPVRLGRRGTFVVGPSVATEAAALEGRSVAVVVDFHRPAPGGAIGEPFEHDRTARGTPRWGAALDPPPDPAGTFTPTAPRFDCRGRWSAWHDHRGRAPRGSRRVKFDGR